MLGGLAGVWGERDTEGGSVARLIARVADELGRRGWPGLGQCLAGCRGRGLGGWRGLFSTGASYS